MEPVRVINDFKIDGDSHVIGIKVIYVNAGNLSKRIADEMVGGWRLESFFFVRCGGHFMRETEKLYNLRDQVFYVKLIKTEIFH